MNGLMKSGYLKEIKGSQNVAYVLENENTFMQTGYKVLKNQEKNRFIKCAKVKYNGKIKLLYFTSGYKSLSHIIHSIDGDTFVGIITSLLHSVIEIKNNGFLLCQNLDLSLDKIFVDQNTMSVCLIYLPINVPPIDMVTFENELRTQLIKLITSVPMLATPKINTVSSYLSNGALSLEELYKKIYEQTGGIYRKSISSSDGNNRDMSSDLKNDVGSQPVLTFTSANGSADLMFKVNKPEFVIGRNQATTDGAVTYNKAIGRMHCKFIYENNNYYIVDLNSANGTYVNNKRIAPMQPHLVKNGDSIRLANSDFAIAF